MESQQAIKADLRAVFSREDIPTSALRHLIAQRHRLVRGVYESADGRGCFIRLLTETLPESMQVRSKADLVRVFGRAPGAPPETACEFSAEYQPVKWLVRLFDGQICSRVVRRYGRVSEPLSFDLIVEVAREVLAERESRTTTAAPARRSHRERVPQAAVLR